MKFRRWQWLSYDWRYPTSDARDESRHVFEDTFRLGLTIPERERPSFLEPLILNSAKEARSKGASLALIRPVESKFRWRRKSDDFIESERLELQNLPVQTSMFDSDLTALDPCPYEFRLSFVDGDGQHHHSCSDWETTAAFWRLEKRYNEEQALIHLDKMYNKVYPEKGMVLAIGTMARRPKTWLLLGIIRLNELEFPEFAV